MYVPSLIEQRAFYQFGGPWPGVDPDTSGAMPKSLPAVLICDRRRGGAQAIVVQGFNLFRRTLDHAGGDGCIVHRIDQDEAARKTYLLIGIEVEWLHALHFNRRYFIHKQEFSRHMGQSIDVHAMMEGCYAGADSAGGMFQEVIGAEGEGLAMHPYQAGLEPA